MWDMATSGPNPLRISEGGGMGRVSAQLLDGILWVVVEGEPAGDCLVAVFRKGLAAGWIKPSMPALVDLTGFVGSVDWAAIHTINGLAPWGTGPAGVSRVAYLVRNSMFGMLIRIMSELFMAAQHRTFRDEADALDWLRRSSVAGTSRTRRPGPT